MTAIESNSTLEVDFGRRPLSPSLADECVGIRWVNHRDPANRAWILGVLAEAVRFELTEGLPLRGFSRPVP